MATKFLTLLRNADIPPGPKFVLVALADYADTNGVAFPGQQKLCEYTGYSLRTVIRNSKYLVEKGYVIRTKHYKNDKMKQARWWYTYKLQPHNWPSNMKLKHIITCQNSTLQPVNMPSTYDNMPTKHDTMSTKSSIESSGESSEGASAQTLYPIKKKAIGKKSKRGEILHGVSGYIKLTSPIDLNKGSEDNITVGKLTVNKLSVNEILSAEKTIDDVDNLKHISDVWVALHGLFFDGFVKPLTVKEKSMLKLFAQQIPNWKRVLTVVLENWGSYTLLAEEEEGAFKLPTRPSISFLHKFRGSAYNYFAKVGPSKGKAKGEAKGKPKSSLSGTLKKVNTGAFGLSAVELAQVLGQEPPADSSD